MRKISFLLACCMLFSLFSFRVGAMSKEKVTVIVDGEMVAFDEEPFIESGRVLVPVRKFMEALGAEVTWDGRTRKVTVHKNQTTIAFFIDSTVAAIDGKAIALDVPARIQRGRTFVPLRFLSENLDFTVLWDGQTRTVTVQTSSIYALPLNERLSILEGRFLIDMPKGTKIMKIPTECTIGSVRHTQLQSPSIEEQFIKLYAQELFAYTTGDMKKDAEIAFRSYLEKNPSCTLTEYQTPNGIETVLIKQNGTDSGQGALQLIAKARDDTLIYLWFEVAEELSEQWDVCENYLMRILDTIQFGDRLLTVQKRTEALLNMDIDIAEGYVLSCQWGVDFETYYIQKMAPIDQPCVYMGIYHGEHPSYSEKLEGYPASQIKKTKGTILGKDITWLYYGESTVNAKSYLQTLVPDTDYWMLHIFIIPSNQDNMEEMRKMACSLRYAAETNQNDTETAEVPADGYFRVDEENGINAFYNERYSKKLAAMEEPVLSAEAQTKQTYRLLSCPSFTHLYCIRVEVDSDQTSGTLFYKILSGGGDNPGQIARSFERKLEKQDVERILSQIEKSDFWNLPTTVDKSGLDGTAIVFEGVQSGKYHVAERWTPDKDDPIYQLITLFIELARERVAVSE